MTQPTLLLCSVGGSHQPIVTAISELKPDFVVFLCTGKDPGTGKPGSDVQVIGTGKVIKQRPNDDHPTLPNIPTLVGLGPDQFEVRLCPADDLDGVYRVSRAALSDLRARFPDVRLVADYTGGTKTMSAGLVAAALELDRVELQLVTGNRDNLVKVRDGWQSAGEAGADELRLLRQMRPYLEGWRSYAYSEAALGLASLVRPKGSLAAKLNTARDLSQAFAAWDRFQHQTALDRLQSYAPVLPDSLKGHIGELQRLTHKDRAKREPALLLDLYLNAQRRAAQGRYDDAVARIYRLLEWTAQWRLWAACGVHTADLPEGFAPEGLELGRDREGRLQAGLFAAWGLVAAKAGGPAAAFFTAEGGAMRHHLQVRNNSILAHGFEPIDQTRWEDFHLWLADKFLPMLLAETRAAGIAKLPRSFPEEYPLDLA